MKFEFDSRYELYTRLVEAGASPKDALQLVDALTAKVVLRPQSLRQRSGLIDDHPSLTAGERNA